MSDKLFGGVEAGGTKFICVVASGPSDIRAKVRIDTTTPRETLGSVIDFFKKESSKIPIESLGIGSFGPIDLDPSSPTYGRITTTPKPGWENVDMAGIIQRGLNLPVKFDTDVNAAVLGEGRWGVAQGLRDFVYMTVGTGIGGGAVSGGQLIHGLLHPEMGHMLIPHDLDLDPFRGSCPFHGDCLEGLASGTSIQKRWGQPAEDLPSGHPAWALEAAYLARAIMNLICILSPQRVILSGGVGKQPELQALVRSQVKILLNNYFKSPQLQEHLGQYIVSPALGDLAGVMGALVLAQQLP
jgi:fructokinase